MQANKKKVKKLYFCSSQKNRQNRPKLEEENIGRGKEK